jgi:hypothetical protein
MNCTINKYSSKELQLNEINGNIGVLTQIKASQICQATNLGRYGPSEIITAWFNQ